MDEDSIIQYDRFTSKEKHYYKIFSRYIRNTSDDNRQLMLDMINKKSKISLRILDWFVTKYANKHQIRYKIRDTDDDLFCVHIDYKAQLKSYKKTYFDPFRRKIKFYYYYDKADKTKYIITTLGQLNFFKWIFSNKVIDYVEENYDKLSKEMNKANKEDKKRKKIKKKSATKLSKKIADVKITAVQTVQNKKIKIVLDFD
jgi:hypothetical protein